MAKKTYIPDYSTEHVATHSKPLARAMATPSSAVAAEMFYPPTILHSNLCSATYARQTSERTRGRTAT
eukprot:6199728-Pleurochrysis_carterae.AAC.1